MNDRPELAELVMLKEFSGNVLKTPRGSLRSLRVSSPVLVTVAVTFKFTSPLTLTLGVETLTAKPGVAKMQTAEATRATRGAWREENIAPWAVEVVGETKVNEASGLRAE